MNLIEVTIESLAGKTGYGVAHFDHTTVFVPFTFPQDTVTIEKIDQKRWYIAKPIEFKQKSPFRTNSICSVHPNTYQQNQTYCGGCPWLTLDYNKQLTYKLHILQRAFSQSQFQLNIPTSIIPSDQSNSYRTRARFLKQNNKIGFRQFLSDQIIDISVCPILKYSEDLKIIKELFDFKGSGEINALWNEKGELHLSYFSKKQLNFNKIKDNFNKIKKIVGIKLNNTIFGKKYLTLYDDSFPLYISSDGFFQAGFTANRLILESLEKLLNTIQKTSLNIVEFHAGAGNLTRILAQNNYVTAIESNPASWKSFEFTFKNHKNVILRKRKDVDFNFSNQKFDLAVLDPPRTGLSKVFTNKLIKNSPPYIILISCDPMAAMRDISRLLQSDYKQIQIIAVDTMPSTPHFELLTLLEK